MSTGFHFYDSSNLSSAYIEHLRQAPKSKIAFGVNASDLVNLNRGKNVTSMILPILWFSRVSSFTHHISRIIKRSPFKKMTRPQASWVVAMVKYLKSSFDSASRNNPTCSRGENKKIVAPSGDVPTVHPHLRASPNPTASKLLFVDGNGPVKINLSPEAFKKGWRKSLRCEERRRIVRPRNQFHWLRHALGCWFTARAFSLSLMPVETQPV